MVRPGTVKDLEAIKRTIAALRILTQDKDHDDDDEAYRHFAGRAWDLLKSQLGRRRGDRAGADGAPQARRRRGRGPAERAPLRDRPDAGNPDRGLNDGGKRNLLRRPLAKAPPYISRGRGGPFLNATEKPLAGHECNITLSVRFGDKSFSIDTRREDLPMFAAHWDEMLESMPPGPPRTDDPESDGRRVLLGMPRTLVLIATTTRRNCSGW